MYLSAFISSAYCGNTDVRILFHRPFWYCGRNVPLVSSLDLGVSAVERIELRPANVPILWHPCARFPVDDARNIPVLVHEDIVRP